VATKTRVLIVDDSAVVRKLIGDRLRKEADIEVVGGAADPYIAREQILLHRPDVLTLDIEMPRMDGITFLKKLMAAHPLPVIVVSSVGTAGSAASIEALRAGAVEVIAKPDGPHSVGQVTDRIVRTIRGLSGGPVARFRPSAVSQGAPVPAAVTRVPRNGLILIGASTGGTQAIEAVLSRMPADSPPVLIVQHMPAHFTQAFAQRLNQLCPMRVVEAGHDQLIERGTAYIAPGDYHMSVVRTGLQLRTALAQGPQEHHQRPAVDVLFRSAALLKGVPMVAMILTGMGSDGADGLLALRQAGAATLAEDEQSCVVFGMPKVAIERGAAAHVTTLLRMPAMVFECFERLAA